MPSVRAADRFTCNMIYLIYVVVNDNVIPFSRKNRKRSLLKRMSFRRMLLDIADGRNAELNRLHFKTTELRTHIICVQAWTRWTFGGFWRRQLQTAIARAVSRSTRDSIRHM
jgi:hypothetical protein